MRFIATHGKKMSDLSVGAVGKGGIRSVDECGTQRQTQSDVCVNRMMHCFCPCFLC